jgi:hypothetical protein
MGIECQRKNLVKRARGARYISELGLLCQLARLVLGVAYGGLLGSTEVHWGLL